MTQVYMMVGAFNIKYSIWLKYTWWLVRLILSTLYVSSIHDGWCV